MFSTIYHRELGLHLHFHNSGGTQHLSKKLMVPRVSRELGKTFFSFFFSFFFVFRGQGLTFSPWVKIYDKLRFWLKACRMAGHDICQGLASGSGIKGMSYIISMIHMQQ